MKPNADGELAVIVAENFEGTPVSFRKDGWVNATQMAQAFGTDPRQYLRTKPAQRYIAAVERKLQKCSAYMQNTPSAVEVIRGNRADGRGQGTWMHRLVALDFARWLSPEFAVWCDEIILGIMTGRSNGMPEPERIRFEPDPKEKRILVLLCEMMGWHSWENQSCALRPIKLRGSASYFASLLCTDTERAYPMPTGKLLRNLSRVCPDFVTFHANHRGRQYEVRRPPRPRPLLQS